MFQRGLTPLDPFGERDVLETARTQDSMSLRTLASMGRVLVVLLPALERARPWLEAVRAARPRLETDGLRLVLVHFDEDLQAVAVLARHDLQYVARIADPERALYARFELGEARRMLGPVRQLPGLVWFEAGDVERVERPRWDQSVPVRLIAEPSGNATPR